MKYINLIPSNVYGPGDHFDPHRSHALGGLISKFKKASENNIDEIEIWGTGNPKEIGFLYMIYVKLYTKQ